jgi:hypothetical protein
LKSSSESEATNVIFSLNNDLAEIISSTANECIIEANERNVLGECILTANINE